MEAVGTTAGVTELPYSVRLDGFEGPLDLLLHLIKKHEVDLYRISVASVTDQYLASVAAATSVNLDVAGEFLVMAATLIYLKSRALLPPEEREELEEDEIDPEARLIGQLLEHERFQRAAAALASLPVLGRDVFRRPLVERAPGDLVEPLRRLLVSDLLAAVERILTRQRMRAPHEIGRESLTLRDGMDMVLARLQPGAEVRFDDLFPEDASRVRIIVTFLAILELIKVGALAAAQEVAYGEIRVVLLRDLDPDDVLGIGDEASA